MKETDNFIPTKEELIVLGHLINELGPDQMKTIAEYINTNTNALIEFVPIERKKSKEESKSFFEDELKFYKTLDLGILKTFYDRNGIDELSLYVNNFEEFISTETKISQHIPLNPVEQNWHKFNRFNLINGENNIFTLIKDYRDLLDPEINTMPQSVIGEERLEKARENFDNNLLDYFISTNKKFVVSSYWNLLMKVLGDMDEIPQEKLKPLISSLIKTQEYFESLGSEDTHAKGAFAYLNFAVSIYKAYSEAFTKDYFEYTKYKVLNSNLKRDSQILSSLIGLQLNSNKDNIEGIEEIFEWYLKEVPEKLTHDYVHGLPFGLKRFPLKKELEDTIINISKNYIEESISSIDNHKHLKSVYEVLDTLFETNKISEKIKDLEEIKAIITISYLLKYPTQYFDLKRMPRFTHINQYYEHITYILKEVDEIPDIFKEKYFWRSDFNLWDNFGLFNLYSDLNPNVKQDLREKYSKEKIGEEKVDSFISQSEKRIDLALKLLLSNSPWKFLDFEEIVKFKTKNDPRRIQLGKIISNILNFPDSENNFFTTYVVFSDEKMFSLDSLNKLAEITEYITFFTKIFSQNLAQERILYHNISREIGLKYISHFNLEDNLNKIREFAKNFIQSNFELKDDEAKIFFDKYKNNVNSIIRLALRFKSESKFKDEYNTLKDIIKCDLSNNLDNLIYGNYLPYNTLIEKTGREYFKDLVDVEEYKKLSLNPTLLVEKLKNEKITEDNVIKKVLEDLTYVSLGDRENNHFNNAFETLPNKPKSYLKEKFGIENALDGQKLLEIFTNENKLNITILNNKITRLKKLFQNTTDNQRTDFYNDLVEFLNLINTYTNPKVIEEKDMDKTYMLAAVIEDPIFMLNIADLTPGYSCLGSGNGYVQHILGYALENKAVVTTLFPTDEFFLNNIKLNDDFVKGKLERGEYTIDFKSRELKLIDDKGIDLGSYSIENLTYRQIMRLGKQVDDDGVEKTVLEFEKRYEDIQYSNQSRIMISKLIDEYSKKSGIEVRKSLREIKIKKTRLLKGIYSDNAGGIINGDTKYITYYI